MKKIFSTIMAIAAIAFSFTSCEDIPAPYEMPGSSSDTPTPGAPTVSTPTGNGTLAEPFNVAAIQSVGSGLAAGQNSSTKYYIQGIVTSFKAGEEPGNSYGNSTFYIGDTSDASSTFYIYRCNGLNNGKFTSASDLMVGDTVVIYGTITNYNGTIETVQKEAYVYSVKHAEGNTGTVVPTPTPDPTPSDAIVKTCEEAKNIALALTENNVATAETYAITGYITSVVGSVSRDQQTFWMADTKDGGQVFEAYWANLPEGVTEFKVGQKVTIVGALMKYNTTPEIKNANVTILEDATTGGGTGDGGSTPTGTSEGVTLDTENATVTLTNAAATAGTETITIELNTLGYENAAEMGTVTLTDGTTIVFDKGSNTNAPKYYTATNGARVYANNTLTFNGTKAIAKIEMTCDVYNGTKYVGNATATVSFDGKTAVYTNASADAGTQLRVKTITITYAK